MTWHGETEHVSVLTIDTARAERYTAAHTAGAAPSISGTDESFPEPR
jgi:hypothetical protein